MRIHTIIRAAAVVGLLTGVAMGEDLNPPEWRGDDFTTYQRWGFDTNALPASPEDVSNPYGNPSATLTDGYYWPTDMFAPTHHGVWQIESDPMELFVPNNPDNIDPGSYKEIVLQVTYSAANDLEPLIMTDPMFSGKPTDLLIAKTEIDDTYWQATYLITIEPNPIEETITLIPRGCTMTIDEAIVDTICLPEPASLALLALGGLALVRTRR